MTRAVVICPICRFPEEPDLWRGHGVIEYDWCYCCSFWVQWMSRRADRRSVRIGGLHFWLLDDFDYGRHAWPHGATWEFEHEDSRVTKHEHVRCQGAIPSRFREFLPTNARRLTFCYQQITSTIIVSSSDLIAERPAMISKPKQAGLF